MNISINGLDDIQKNFDELQKKLNSIEGEHKVPIVELISTEFMKRYTNFQSIEEMMKEGGIDIESASESQIESNTAWNEFVSKNTEFNSWKEMLVVAGEKYISDKLDL